MNDLYSLLRLESLLHQIQISLVPVLVDLCVYSWLMVIDLFRVM